MTLYLIKFFLVTFLITGLLLAPFFVPQIQFLLWLKSLKKKMGGKKEESIFNSNKVSFVRDRVTYTVFNTFQLRYPNPARRLFFFDPMNALAGGIMEIEASGMLGHEHHFLLVLERKNVFAALLGGERPEEISIGIPEFDRRYTLSCIESDKTIELFNAINVELGFSWLRHFKRIEISVFGGGIIFRFNVKRFYVGRKAYDSAVQIAVMACKCFTVKKF